VGKASLGKEQGTVTARKLQTAREFNPTCRPTRRLTASRSAFRSNFPSRISSLTQHLRVVISRLAGPARFPLLRVISHPPSSSSFRLARKSTNLAARNLSASLQFSAAFRGDGTQTAPCRGSVDFLMNYLGQARRSCQLARASLTRI